MNRKRSWKWPWTTAEPSGSQEVAEGQDGVSHAHPEHRKQVEALEQALLALAGERAACEQARDEARRQLAKVTAQLENLRTAQGFVSPGHFYSPVPDFQAAAREADRVNHEAGPLLPGIRLDAEAQLDLLRKFEPFYRELPFEAEKRSGYRYHYENPSYSYPDAVLLFCMMRYAEPRRIIEIGSGYSSCAILDTNELFFDDGIETTFIEPYPELMVSLLEDTDLGRIRLITEPLQEVDPTCFDALQANDILFIDSTHVCKIGSDVNVIFAQILPRLAPGVLVHFHDIFYPFEYPRPWFEEGRAWNEAYVLRAFLQYNDAFEIVLMNTFLQRFQHAYFETHMPLCLKNTGGSIWLRKK